MPKDAEILVCFKKHFDKLLKEMRRKGNKYSSWEAAANIPKLAMLETVKEFYEKGLHDAVYSDHNSTDDSSVDWCCS